MSTAGVRSFGDESELLSAAHLLSGRTIAELAQAVACAWPDSPVRDKGFVGRTVERALGLRGSKRAVADCPELGVELKTLPVSRDGKPRESTFVCYVGLSDLVETPWCDSRVAIKLARVLFVPIESEPGLAIAQRRLGRAFLWSASQAEGRVLERDYAQIAARVAEGHVEALDARLGEALQLRPKAAHGAVRVRITDGEGDSLLAQPRAFYLRASFTACVLREALLG